MPHAFARCRSITSVPNSAGRPARLRTVTTTMLGVACLAAGVLAPGHAPLFAGLSACHALLRHARRRKQPADVRARDAPPPDGGAVEWDNVALSAAGRDILCGARGRADAGRVLALLGASGSGKTSLLCALGGRVGAAGVAALQGELRVGGVRVGGVDCAYVPQEDLFFSMLTVRETLALAARLRGGMGEEFVERVVAGLGLGECADARVGGGKVRGISGGERKRLSLACELVASPRVILADEPLSGVDSFQAERVMGALRALAREGGHTVVVSVHQPSGKILGMCDDLMLLSGGRVVWTGAVAGAAPWFAAQGHPVPEGYTLAEHLLEVSSVDAESDASAAGSRKRIGDLVAAFEEDTPGVPRAPVGGAEGVEAGESGEGTGKRGSALAALAEGGGGVGPLAQLRALAVRAFRQVVRDKKTNVSRLMSSVMSALTFGAVYWRMGYGQSTIQDRLGLLQVCCINAAMSALVKTLQVFGTERAVVARERARGAYGVLPYFTSKLCAELPMSAAFPLAFSALVYPMCGLSGGLGRIGRFVGIITLEAFTAASYGLLVGSAAPTPEAAVAIGPASFVVFIVFGGLYVSEANVPRALRWLPRVSIIKHAFEGLCVNEFRGLVFETDRPWDVKTGEQQLARLGWAESSVAATCVSQARVLVFNYLATYAVLCARAPKYVKMAPVDDDAVVVEELPAAKAAPPAENGAGNFRGGKKIDSVQLD